MTPIGWRVWFSDLHVMQSTTHTLDQVAEYAALREAPVVFAMLYMDEQWAPGKPYREDRSGGDFIELYGRIFPGVQMTDAEFEYVKREAYRAETL